LYEKLKKDAFHATFSEEQIEMEDAQGNTMSLPDFERLRRQGLI